MRFLVDACAGVRVAMWLRGCGHDASCICEPGTIDATAPDHMVLACAREQQRIVVTLDTDFGDLVVRRRMPHSGVVILRSDDDRTQALFDLLARLLDHRPTLTLADRLTIVDQRRIRQTLTESQETKDNDHG